MPIRRSTRYATLGLMLGGLACAGNRPQPDESAAARDTTATQNAPGYRTKPDTSQVPPGTAGTPVDTSGNTYPALGDTVVPAGAERNDTAAVNERAPADTTGFRPGNQQMDTTGYRQRPGAPAELQHGEQTDSSSG